MQTENTFILHPTPDQVNALKAFIKALKIKFEITKKEKPYDPEFVNMVLEAEEGIKQGKGLNLTSEEFDNLWK